jgi:hypothetical protein
MDPMTMDNNIIEEEDDQDGVASDLEPENQLEREI